MSKTGRSRAENVRNPRARLHRSMLAGSLAWALICPTLAQALPETAAANELLFVTVVRNGVPLPDVLWEIQQRTGEDGKTGVWVKASEFVQAGLALEDTSTEWVALDGLAGVTYTLDLKQQLLSLQAAVARLSDAPQRLSPSRENHPLSPGVRGVVLDYDLAAQGFAGSRQASAWGQLRTLGGAGQLSQTFRVDAGRSDGQSLNSSTRLDTQWTWQDPERMRFVTVGDSISGSVDWSRPVRFAGIQVGRDFSLQPYRTTTPRLVLSSSAALPSTVDVILDGAQADRREILPGRFLLDVPIPTTGVGQARVVVTDVQGFVQEVDVPLYGTSRLLEKWLMDGSIEAGYLRRDYGLRSSSYDNQPFASVSARRGMTNALTLDAHAEWRDGLGVWGIGASALMPKQWGVINASVAQRVGQAPQGWAERGRLQHSWGWQRQGEHFSAGVSSTRRQAGFLDVVAAAEGFPLARATDQAWAGLSSDWGQWAVSYNRQRLPAFGPWPTQEQRVVAASWAAYTDRVSTNVSVQYDLERKETSAFLSVSIPLGERSRLQMSRYQASGRARTGATWSSPVVGEEPAWGGRAGMAVDDSGRLDEAWAQVDRQGQHVEWNAGLAKRAGELSWWGQGRGGVAWLEDQGIRWSRRTDGAFAMVDAGLPNVPVLLENRPVGVTAPDGKLLVERLRPWQANRVSIDTTKLPVDVVVDGLDERFAVPRQGQGAQVAFDVHRTTALEGVLQADGQPIAAGTRLTWLDARGQTLATGVVGNDGAFWVEATGLAIDRVRVDTPQGPCQARFPATLPERNDVGTVALGALSCNRLETVP